MSLKVWLPLTDNFENKGAGNTTITNNSCTITSGGKLGNCCNFNGTNNSMFVSNIGRPENISVAMWVKRNANTSSRQFLFTAWNGISVELAANDSVFGRISTTNSGTKDCYGNTITTSSGWVHIAFTFEDGVGSKFYVNGNLISSNNFTTPIVWSTDYGYVGLYSSIYFNGCINDFRIYDHALSPAEVHKLAQGLVLHYKLDGEGTIIVPKEYQQLEYLESTGTQKIDTGIVPQNTFKYQFKYMFTEISGYKGVFGAYSAETANAYRLIPANGSTANVLVNFESKAGGGSVTVSGITTGVNELVEGQLSKYEYCLNNITKSINKRAYNATDLFTTKGTALSETMKLFVSASDPSKCKIYYFYTYDYATNKYIQMLVPVRRISDNVLGMYDTVTGIFFTNVGSGAFISGDVLPVTKVKDSSGYGRHGTVTGTFSIDSNSPKNNACTFLPTGTVYASTTLPTAALANTYTFAYWGKSSVTNNMPFGFGDGNRLNPYYSSKFCWNTGDGTSNPFGSYTGSQLNNGVWHHYAITGDGTTTKLYIDGEFASNATTYRPITGSIFYISGWDVGSSYKWNGYLSDLRVYSTPLSADDILALYKTETKIPSHSDIHSYAFDEEGSRELMAGTVWTNGYSVHTITPTTHLSSGECELTGQISISTPYISISPSGHTYVYDIEVSTDASNMFYIGFERYDKDKTARSNNACVYLTGLNGTASERTHQRYHGTVNLSTDGVNPCAFITLRILNDWSSPNNRKATIHYISLREVSTVQTPTIGNNGVFTVDELKENSKAAFFKDGFVESTEFIEM